MAMFGVQGDGNTHFAGEYAEGGRGGVGFPFENSEPAAFFGEGSRSIINSLLHAQADDRALELCDDGRIHDCVNRPSGRLITRRPESGHVRGGWRLRSRGPIRIFRLQVGM